MQFRAAPVVRLAVYVVALLVVVDAPVTPVLRTARAALAVRVAPPPSTAPVRVGLASVLVAGILSELLRRRQVWR